MIDDFRAKQAALIASEAKIVANNKLALEKQRFMEVGVDESTNFILSLIRQNAEKGRFVLFLVPWHEKGLKEILERYSYIDISAIIKRIEDLGYHITSFGTRTDQYKISWENI